MVFWQLDSQVGLLLFNGNNFHLQVNTQWQFLDGDTRSSRLVLAEVLAVNQVELSKLSLHVGQKDVGLHNVVQRRVGGLQDISHILDHLLSLFGNSGVTWQWLVLGGVGNLARNVNETYNLLVLFFNLNPDRQCDLTHHITLALS